MTEVVRVDRARDGDLSDLLGIAAAARELSARYQPRFWRPALDAVERQREFFQALLTDGDALVVVGRRGTTSCGFGTARIVSAPPVYDPGGPTCVVDDFAVTDPDDWPEIGPALMRAIRDWAADRGAVQFVVVTAQLDEAKRAVLRAGGLSVASEWWVGPVVTSDDSD